MKRITLIPNDNQVTIEQDDGTIDIGRCDLSKLLPRWVHVIHYDMVNKVCDVEFIRPGNQQYALADALLRFPELTSMIEAGAASAAEERARINARKELYDATVEQTRRTEEEFAAAQARLIEAGMLTPEGGPVPAKAPDSHGPGGHTHG